MIVGKIEIGNTERIRRLFLGVQVEDDVQSEYIAVEAEGRGGIPAALIGSDSMAASWQSSIEIQHLNSLLFVRQAHSMDVGLFLQETQPVNTQIN